MLHPHDIRYFPWTIRIIKFAEILAQRGHEVTLVHPSIPAQHLREFPREPIFEVPPDAGYRVVRLRSRVRHIPENLRTILSLSRWADIIHVQKCHAGVMLPALAASWRRNLPIHYDWDDHEEAIVYRQAYSMPRGMVRLTRHYERRVHRFAETISVASEGLRRLALERGIPEEILFDAPVGADLETYSPDVDGSWVRTQPEHPIGDRPLILYLGQLEGAAYAELLLRAAGRIREIHPNARLLVVGGGLMLPALQQKATEMGLDGWVYFSGYVRRERVPFYVAAADIAVACFEDNEVTRCKSPLKIAEYLAAGKAIVASRVGDVPRMVGNAGLLVRPGDTESLVDAVVRLLEDVKLRTQAAKCARTRAETIFNWERTVDNLERAYGKTLDA
jgi:glycosyltransferase involved in cell wall biosynthesis